MIDTARHFLPVSVIKVCWSYACWCCARQLGVKNANCVSWGQPGCRAHSPLAALQCCPSAPSPATLRPPQMCSEQQPCCRAPLLLPL